MKYSLTLWHREESLLTMKLRDREHAHFTNTYCACECDCDDDMMLPISIERRSGPDMRQYIELDYCCKACFKKYENIKRTRVPV